MPDVKSSKLVTDLALTADAYSPWVDARHYEDLQFQLVNVATGSPVGAWSVQESNDTDTIRREMLQGVAAASSAAKVVELSSSSRYVIDGTGLAVSGANATLVTVHNPALWVRLKFTYTSGGSSSSLAQVFVAGRTHL